MRKRFVRDSSCIRGHENSHHIIVQSSDDRSDDENMENKDAEIARI